MSVRVLSAVERHGRTGTAHTSRSGGVSSGAYAGLNLGDHVGDEPAAVAENRRRLADAVGAGVLAVARQVHGRAVAVVDGPWPGEPPEADALVTATPGVALAVLVADCTPVLLAAPDEGLVGVAHAGRQGLVLGVVDAAVQALRDLGAGRLVARVGPSVCPRHYEVPAALREEVGHVVPEARSASRHGTPAVDVAAGVLAQLAAAGTDELDVLPGCSWERADLYSYRRDGTTGRYAGVAWLEA